MTEPARGYDPLLTPEEAAERLSVSAETVRRWMRKGVIRYVEVGPYRRKRIRASDADAQCRDTGEGQATP